MENHPNAHVFPRTAQEVVNIHGMTARANRLARELNEQREAFKAFLTARGGSAAEAEDIPPNGLRADL